MLSSSAGAVDERTGGELGGEARLLPGFESSASFASLARPVGAALAAAGAGGLALLAASGAFCDPLDDCLEGASLAVALCGAVLFVCGRFSSEGTHELIDGLLLVAVVVVDFVVVLLFDTCGFVAPGAFGCCAFDML